MMLEHLEQLVDVLKALNTIDVETPRDPGMSLLLSNRLPLVSDDNELHGYVSDEIGGCWSFETATPEERRKWSIRP